MELKTKLFKKDGQWVTFEDLLKKIYDNSEDRTAQIKIIVDHLKDMVGNTGDAAILTPWIAEFMKAAIKNDDNLIKLASIANRAMTAKKGNETVSMEGLIPSSMKSEWLKELEKEN